MNIVRLIEAVKYGEDVAPYGTDFREDLIDALEEIEALREQLDEAREALPTPEDFDELGGHLMANPEAFNTFVEIMNHLERVKSGV